MRPPPVRDPGITTDKFLTAIAGSQIKRAQPVDNACGEVAQDSITRIMAPGVIDAFEVIDVGDQDGYRGAADYWRYRPPGGARDAM